MFKEEGYITLYQLTKKIETALKDPDLSYKWVTFEIKSISVNQSNGHCYLELIEKSQIGTTIASARGTIWCSTYLKIYSKFTKTTGMGLQRGMKLLALVSVSYHSLYGISINIIDIDPTFTLGESERIRRETIERLHADGIWDQNKTIPIPTIIQNIAVISSPTAAGYGDFCKQIEESGLIFNITLFESLVQGSQAEQSIMSALEKICRQEEKYDAIVIIRGGGASGDLDCFDGYKVCFAIASMSLPVITGIGHDRDESIADMVSAIRLKTPTAVAAWLINKNSDFLSEMEEKIASINNKAQSIIMGLWNQHELNCGLLRHYTESILTAKNLQLSECRNRLNRITSNVSVREQSRISRKEEILRQGTRKFLSQKQSSLILSEQSLTMKWKISNEKAQNMLTTRSQQLQAITATKCERFQATADRLTLELRNSIKLLLEREQIKITVLKDKIKISATTFLKNKQEKNSSLFQLTLSHSPKNVLQRGYAIVRKEGKIIPSTKQLSAGDHLDIELRDGIIKSEIIN